MVDEEFLWVIALNTSVAAAAGIFHMNRPQNLGKQFTVSGNGKPLSSLPQPIERKKRLLSAYGIFAGLCGLAYSALLLGYFKNTQIPPYITQAIIAFIIGYAGHLIAELLDFVAFSRVLHRASE